MWGIQGNTGSPGASSALLNLLLVEEKEWSMEKFKNILRHWIPLAVAITAMCGVAYLLTQQVLRWGANDPQIQMAEDAAVYIQNGGTMAEVAPSSIVDIGASLSPFMIIFDETGKETAASGLLHGETPALVPGMLDSARSTGETRVTWEPEPGIRLATVVVHMKGTKGGFVLAARSLREVEDFYAQIVSITWLALAASLLVSLLVVVIVELALPVKPVVLPAKKR
jgi:hypothetical protein